MTLSVTHPALVDPWDAAQRGGTGTVLALLTATHGPAYRNPGAAMAIFPDGHYVGAITSGCIEADLVLHAQEVRASGQPKHLRYGEGSPFIDMRLPCGGAVEIDLVRIQDHHVLADLAAARRARQAVSLRISPEGRFSLADWRETGPDAAHGFSVGFPPPLRFVVFGAGPEASLFASLVRSLGYEQLLVSHEDTSLNAARALGCEVMKISKVTDLDTLKIDADCATVLFYHDHDYEPAILKYLLTTPAFYIGAQGSRSTQRTRLMRLAEMGVSQEAMARVRGPIGLIPSSRDPRTLAVSVLAEIIGHSDVVRTGLVPAKGALQAV